MGHLLTSTPVMKPTLIGRRENKWNYVVSNENVTDNGGTGEFFHACLEIRDLFNSNNEYVGSSRYFVPEYTYLNIVRGFARMCKDKQILLSNNDRSAVRAMRRFFQTDTDSKLITEMWKDGKMWGDHVTYFNLIEVLNLIQTLRSHLVATYGLTVGEELVPSLDKKHVQWNYLAELGFEDGTSPYRYWVQGVNEYIGRVPRYHEMVTAEELLLRTVNKCVQSVYR